MIFLIEASSRNVTMIGNVAVTGTATTSCLKIRFYNVLSNATYFPSHCQVGNSNDKYTVNTSQRSRFI